jgi:hypothetical protein
VPRGPGRGSGGEAIANGEASRRQWRTVFVGYCLGPATACAIASGSRRWARARPGPRPSWRPGR